MVIKYDGVELMIISFITIGIIIELFTLFYQIVSDLCDKIYAKFYRYFVIRKVRRIFKKYYKKYGEDDGYLAIASVLFRCEKFGRTSDEEVEAELKRYLKNN